MRKFLLAATLTVATGLFAADPYTITQLTSDVAGVGTFTDTKLVNAWGLARSPTGPWWVNANGTGLSLVYDAMGDPGSSPVIVSVQVPAGGTPPSAPTGLVFNSTTAFPLTPGNPSLFLFVTEGGTIAGWNPAVSPSHAITKIDNSTTGAVYKGVALGMLNGANVLYAANFHAGTVEVYRGDFAKVPLDTTAFVDPMVPAGYGPFNVANIGGLIYVAYAKQDPDAKDDVPGPGFGYVTIFNADGTMVRRLQHGSWMNAPWAIVQAGSNFGSMSGMIIVGNFGNGSVVGFDATTGAVAAIMRGPNGKAVVIPGLWGLGFGNDGAGGPSSSLYFAAGGRSEAHGLFGTLTVTTPPPGVQ
ncbi:MAG: TIGR03118 family protein [Bryobacteraceae bacterium]